MCQSLLQKDAFFARIRTFAQNATVATDTILVEFGVSLRNLAVKLVVLVVSGGGHRA